MDGDPGATTRVVCTDSPQALAAGLKVSSNKTAHFCIITVELKQIRYGFGGVTVSQGTTGLGHIAYAGDVILLESVKQIDEFRFINGTNGEDATIQVTSEF